MKFIYFLLPFISSALADSLITCPCNQQNCSKAADPCNCENHNIVNKYFCCDANTVRPKDLGLKECKTSSIFVLGPNGEHYICGGPDKLSCNGADATCNILSGWKGADDSTPWGLCSYPRGPSHSPKSVGSATPSVPVSTSTVVETTTAALSTLGVVTTTTTSITSTQSALSTLVVVTTTTTTSTTFTKSAPLATFK